MHIIVYEQQCSASCVVIVLVLVCDSKSVSTSPKTNRDRFLIWFSFFFYLFRIKCRFFFHACNWIKRFNTMLWFNWDTRDDDTSNNTAHFSVCVFVGLSVCLSLSLYLSVSFFFQPTNTYSTEIDACIVHWIRSHVVRWFVSFRVWNRLHFKKEQLWLLLLHLALNSIDYTTAFDIIVHSISFLFSSFRFQWSAGLLFNILPQMHSINVTT